MGCLDCVIIVLIDCKCTKAVSGSLCLRYVIAQTVVSSILLTSLLKRSWSKLFELVSDAMYCDEVGGKCMPLVVAAAAGVDGICEVTVYGNIPGNICTNSIPR